MVKWTKAMMAAASHQFMNARQRSRDKIRLTRKIRKAAIRAQVKDYKPRDTQERPNYGASTWGRMLNNDRIKNPVDKKGGKQFRRRFRIPYPTFLKIVEMTREAKWFSEEPNCAGQEAAPLELKILAVLRVLGRGYCFDGVEELCLISAEVLRVFFHKFCKLFSEANFSVYCSPPTSDEDIAKTVNIYERLGLPGAIGSVDCVHIRWERCPAGERSLHKGKEGFPTLSYEVTVDHTKRIIGATQGHPGARNDKTIVKFDGFVTSIHNGEVYAEVTFTLLDADGAERVEKGLYLIVDGGYHKWRCLQCPFKHTSKPAQALWSKWVESVRKDVECTFGILKGRFRCLKLPIYYHSKEAIDNMFFTCCILHNMLLSHDGLDSRWENGVNWAGQDGEHDKEDIHIFRRHLSRVRNVVPNTDFSSLVITGPRMTLSSSNYPFGMINGNLIR
jgi:hypothetical protein